MPETTELSCGKEEGNSCSLPHHTLMQSTICPKALINFYAYCRPVSALKFIKVTLKEADSSGAAPLFLEVALPILNSLIVQHKWRTIMGTQLGGPLQGPSFSCLSQSLLHWQWSFIIVSCVSCPKTAGGIKAKGQEMSPQMMKGSG